MSEWGVVLVIIAVVGLIVTVTTPIVKLVTSITKLTTVVDRLQKDVNEILTDNSSDHDVFHKKDEEQDRILANHEMRIGIAEKVIGA